MSHPATRWASVCLATGKRSYYSKKAAKAASRVMGGAMAAYSCQPDPDLDAHWHLGHLPKTGGGR